MLIILRENRKINKLTLLLDKEKKGYQIKEKGVVLIMNPTVKLCRTTSNIYMEFITQFLLLKKKFMVDF